MTLVFNEDDYWYMKDESPHSTNIATWIDYSCSCRLGKSSIAGRETADHAFSFSKMNCFVS